LGGGWPPRVQKFTPGRSAFFGLLVASVSRAGVRPLASVCVGLDAFGLGRLQAPTMLLRFFLGLAGIGLFFFLVFRFFFPFLRRVRLFHPPLRSAFPSFT